MTAREAFACQDAALLEIRGIAQRNDAWQQHGTGLQGLGESMSQRPRGAARWHIDRGGGIIPFPCRKIDTKAAIYTGRDKRAQEGRTRRNRPDPWL